MRDINSRNVSDPDREFRIDQGQMLIYRSRGCIRLSVLAIAVFVLSATVCQMITFELPNVVYSNNKDVHNFDDNVGPTLSTFAKKRRLWIQSFVRSI